MVLITRPEAANFALARQNHLRRQVHFIACCLGHIALLVLSAAAAPIAFA
jgi:hypothetical protein